VVARAAPLGISPVCPRSVLRRSDSGIATVADRAGLKAEQRRRLLVGQIERMRKEGQRRGARVTEPPVMSKK
jgi:hypothetical protein